MRCKRCGEILEPGDTKCPVCGKTLTPPRKRPPAQKPSETNIKVPQLDKFTHAYSRDAAQSRMLQLVTILAVAAAIVLLVVVYLGIGNLRDSVDQFRQSADAQFESLHNQTPAAPEVPEEPQQTEPQGETPTQLPQPQSLSQQDVEATLTLHHTAGVTHAAAVMQLGDYEDRVIPWVGSAMDVVGRRTEASWILEQSGDRLDVQLRDSYGVGDNPVDIALTWTLKGSTFASLSGTMCTWEYRVPGGEWKDVPTDLLTPVGGGCELKMTADALTGLLGTGSELELRCRVSMTHPDGGALKLVVEGIVFGSEGLKDGGSLTD